MLTKLRVNGLHVEAHVKLHLKSSRSCLHKRRYFEVLGELQRGDPLILGNDLLVARHLLRERLRGVAAGRGKLPSAPVGAVGC